MFRLKLTFPGVKGKFANFVCFTVPQKHLEQPLPSSDSVFRALPHSPWICQACSTYRAICFEWLAACAVGYSVEKSPRARCDLEYYNSHPLGPHARVLYLATCRVCVAHG